MQSGNRKMGSLLGGAFLVAFGILALLTQLIQPFDFWANGWPLIIIACGAIFFVGMGAGGKNAAALAIPGSIFVGIGLMMFIQNMTSHWESWAYGWAVIIMSVGAGIAIMGAWAGEKSQRQAGLNVLKIGTILFVIFGAFFEMIFNNAPVAQIFFPIALILLGGYLFLANSGMFTRKGKSAGEPTKETKASKK